MLRFLSVPLAIAVAPHSVLQQLLGSEDAPDWEDLDFYDRLAIGLWRGVVPLANSEEVQDFAPYMRILPQVGEFTTPIYWTDDERALLNDTSCFPRIVRELRSERDRFAYLQSWVRDAPNHVELPAPESFTFDMLQWALSVVQSRLFTVSFGKDLFQPALVPFADMINFGGDAEANVVSRSSDNHRSFDHFITMKTVKKGDQLLGEYSTGLGNCDMLFMYGFTLPERLGYQMGIDLGSVDPLFEFKSSLLEQGGRSYPRTGMYYLTENDGRNVSSELLTALRIFNLNAEESTFNRALYMAYEGKISVENEYACLDHLKEIARGELARFDTSLTKDLLSARRARSSRKSLALSVQISEKSTLESILLLKNTSEQLTEARTRLDAKIGAKIAKLIEKKKALKTAKTAVHDEL